MPADWGTFRERGGLWVLAQSVLMPAVVVLGAAFPGDWTNEVLLGAGLALLLIGAAVGLAGVSALKSNRTPFPKPRAGSRLVREGIYRFIRHPLYTSVMSASLGWALLWQSGPALAAALLLVPFFVAKARREERWLRQAFPEYADYARRTRRFIPWIF